VGGKSKVPRRKNSHWPGELKEGELKRGEVKISTKISMDGKVGGVLAVGAVIAAIAAPRLYKDPYVIRHALHLSKASSVPIQVDVFLAVLVWALALFTGLAFLGGSNVKRVIRKHYRMQRDELIDAVKSTWNMRWVLLFQYLAVGGLSHCHCKRERF